MRRRRYFFLLLGVLAVALVLLVLSREPSYGGRTLSQWVEGYCDSIDRARYQRGERDEAIRRIGTNAIPYLLRWIQYDTPPWKRKLYSGANLALKRTAPCCQFTDEKKQLRGDGVVFALMALGAEAQRVVGHLSALASDPATSRIVAGRAANALACIDPRLWNNPAAPLRPVRP